MNMNGVGGEGEEREEGEEETSLVEVGGKVANLTLEDKLVSVPRPHHSSLLMNASHHISVPSS